MSGRRYRVHEFAELAGVTVKALRHYDRLGLLKPARTATRYRVYVEKDLERLEQIVALKFLGLSLAHIRQVLDRGDVPLADALRVQRQVLLEQRSRLDRAIDAIQNVERSLEGGAPSETAILTQLIEVIAMQHDIDWMKKYYADEAWARWKPHYAQEPSPELVALLAEGEALIGTDPGSDAARSVLQRWGDYWIRATSRDPQIFEGMMRAWYDRENWPAWFREQQHVARTERVIFYLGEVMWERMARSCETSSSRVSFPHRAGESRLAFYREVDSALVEDPAGPRGRELARRWNAILDQESGGDAETRASLLNSWRSRGTWPPPMRAWVAGCYMMSEARWERVSRFLESAMAARAGAG